MPLLFSSTNTYLKFDGLKNGEEPFSYEVVRLLSCHTQSQFLKKLQSILKHRRCFKTNTKHFLYFDPKVIRIVSFQSLWLSGACIPIIPDNTYCWTFQKGFISLPDVEVSPFFSEG